ncbi:aspartate aminotransferase family protein [Vibrio navarrensis]|uniref:pyridoxal phosphate-dependent decarboxylase family protein n=1 Tax=Vibrio navarrensis TaxID=29495 RepID=UPI001558687B|nr:pyridoxal-dependent decarboxylase [Vibrio navarrensis]EHA1126635.1 aspartate aminotransferase family protein [Vibrio navarrensis]
MDKVTSHSWLDEKHNRLSARFAERHQSVLRQFFARDPNLWPLYKIKEIKELVNSKKNLFTPYNLALRHRISSESVIPQQVNPLVRFDPLALYAAATTKNWDDPASVENVISTPCDPAIHGAMLATIANPNLVYSEYAGNATELEKVVVRQMANLVGYDTADATGLFTQGGTFCNLYGYLLGLRKCFPESVMHGFRDKQFAFINSQAGHYSNMTNLSLLGVNIEEQLIRVRLRENNQIDVQDLAKQLDKCLQEGKAVPTILLTFGTTDTFAIDDVAEVYLTRERICRQYELSYRPHIHVDAAVGWSLLFFRDYDFAQNPLGINSATLDGIEGHASLINGLRFADSISIDFQKWGYVPYTSSLLLVKKRQDMEFLKQDPNYFSYFEPQQRDNTHLQATIECSRSAVGVFSAYSALASMGFEGYQTLVAHGLQNANYMRCLLSQWPNCYVVSGENQGPCVTFRLYNPQLKESARAQFYRERRLIKQKAYMENIVSSATFHRNHFLSRQRRELKTNWITSMARTNYDEQGHCLFLPGEKAVFLNPNTRRSDIEAFVHGLFS